MTNSSFKQIKTMEKKKQITEQDLLDYGFKKVEDGVIIHWEKALPNENPLNSDNDETGLTIAVTNLWVDTGSFVIMLPDGSMLNLNIKSLRHLKIIENALCFFDPNF